MTIIEDKRSRTIRRGLTLALIILAFCAGFAFAGMPVTVENDQTIDYGNGTIEHAHYDLDTTGWYAFGWYFLGNDLPTVDWP